MPLYVDPASVAQFYGLAQRLGSVPAELRREVREAVAEAAEPVASAARRNASWSTTIPPRIAVRTSFTASNPRSEVRARQGTEGASRVVKAYEGLTGQSFRHPVFGNRNVWVSQAARPYLFPAVRSQGGALVRNVTEAVEVVLSRV